MPTKRQLDIFLAVARHGSMRMAADEEGISQPSVSKHIRALEQSLGGSLFVRQRGARAKLSELGQQLQAEALEVVARHDDMVLKASAGTAPRRLRVFIRSFLFSEMEDALVDMQLRGIEPDLKFEIVSYDQPIDPLVMANDDSIGLYRSNSLAKVEGLEAEILRADNCLLYAHPDYVAGHVRDGKPMKNFRVFVPDHADFARWMTYHLEVAGIARSHWRETTWFPAAIMRKVLAGEAAAVFFTAHAEQHVQTGELQAIPVDFSPVYLHMVANPKIGPHQRKAFRQDIARLLL